MRIGIQIVYRQIKHYNGKYKINTKLVLNDNKYTTNKVDTQWD